VWYKWRAAFHSHFDPSQQSSDQETPNRELRTLWEFTVAPNAWEMQKGCLLAGAIAIVVCLFYNEWPFGNETSLKEALMVNVVTAVFCVLAAVAMSALHFSGH
jgi:hypothetical protein